MHSEYLMLMSAVLDQEATPAEAQRLNEHLRWCSVCGVQWRQWQALDKRLSAAPLLEAPAGLADRVVARLDEVMLRRRRARWLVLGLFGGLAALATIVAIWGGLAAALLPGGMARVSGLWMAIAQWLSALFLLLQGALVAVAGVGAPAVAGSVGVLACATCVLGATWLWLLKRGELIRPAAAVGR